jgi:hypothetical protein
MTDREMAEALVISEASAGTSIKRLLRTVGVHNRLQAVLKGMRCGMVNQSLRPEGHRRYRLRDGDPEPPGSEARAGVLRPPGGRPIPDNPPS